MKLKFWTKIIMILVILTLISGCIFLPQKPGYVKILVYSGNPNSPTSVVSCMETLFVGIEGLKAYERYDIEIQNSDGTIMAKYALNATGEGKLPPTAMWPEAGLLPVVDDGPVDPGSDIQVGSYKIVLTGPETNVTFPFSVISKNTPTIWSSTITGEITNGYQEGETIYVSGMNFVKDSKVDIYIMRDADLWNDGTYLDDDYMYVYKVEDVPIGPDGKLHKDLIAAAIDAGHGNCANFDIIVDVDQDGVLGPKDVVDSRNAAGYTVQMAPPALPPAYIKMQLASNGKAIDYTTHWEDEFWYPDYFKQDGSDTGFPWEGFGRGVFCILNPIIDDTGANGLVPWSMVQIWVIKASDFATLATRPIPYKLTGLDVSDPQGRPDLVWVQQTCSNGAGSILIWQAPLKDRRPAETGSTVNDGDGFVVIVEKPDLNGEFDDIYEPGSDYIDGVLNFPDPSDPDKGFMVTDIIP